MALIPAHVLVALVASAQPAGTMPEPAPGDTVVPFRTDLAPRIDPVYGDATTLRADVDAFVKLAADMKTSGDEFATAVHATLAELAKGSRRHSQRCAQIAIPYRRAFAAAGRYLELGRRLEARYRAIRRLQAAGEAPGLTPDYRLQVQRARELYVALLRDFREMRVAFHEQLAGEMRYAGCKLEAARGADTDPATAAAWQLAAEDAPIPEDGASERAPRGSGKGRDPRRPRGGSKGPAPSPRPTLETAVWIRVDNTHCVEPGRIAIDGKPAGEVAAGRTTSIRVPAGPHDICVLPTSDRRVCGASGTVRHAYFHDGWNVSVRCQAGTRGPTDRDGGVDTRGPGTSSGATIPAPRRAAPADPAVPANTTGDAGTRAPGAGQPAGKR